jgi:subtilisin family serine protease
VLRRLNLFVVFALAAAGLIPLAAAQISTAQTQRQVALAVSQPIPGRLLILYRNHAIPADADSLARAAGARALHHFRHLGVTALSVPSADEPRALAQLAANPQVAVVLHDRYVTAHSILFNRIQLAVALDAGDPATSASGTSSTITRHSVARAPIKPRTDPDTSSNSGSGNSSSSTSTLSNNPPPPATDTLYTSSQGWAVRATGGYGDSVPGGSATGPWNTSLGAGVRIAILDSGVDANHPDIRPNLALNLSEVNQNAQTGLPSACDDGSPQDQSGHGTWTASLAAGALGPGTGDVIGVAPQATILNIKVLERMPASGISDPTAACEAGQPGGLLSWVLQGIDDAVANHADIIALSLGTLVDTSTGEGAGLKAAFDQATYAATQAGSVVIAALGNDGLDLSTGTLVELPAEARGVLAITASTNPDCAENLTAGATCAAGPVTRPYYSNYDAGLNAIAAPGGSYPEGPATAGTTSQTGWIMGACSSGLTNTTDGLPVNGQSLGCFDLGHTQYVQAMGTSASAALAAGAAALLRAARPDLTAAQIVDALRSSATPAASMKEPQLNLAAALALP